MQYSTSAMSRRKKKGISRYGISEVQKSNTYNEKQKKMSLTSVHKSFCMKV